MTLHLSSSIGPSMSQHLSHTWDTPLKGSRLLGVVGFPDDKEDGDHMYEHFTEVSQSLVF